jgi:hypothetical protein
MAASPSSLVCRGTAAAPRCTSTSGGQGLAARPRLGATVARSTMGGSLGGDPAAGTGGHGVSNPLLDPIVARPPVNPDPDLINEDFTPTTVEHRTFDTLDFATFW